MMGNLRDQRIQNARKIIENVSINSKRFLNPTLQEEISDNDY